MAFKKYPRIKRCGHPDTDELYRDPADTLIITEKLDGNNFRFTRDGDELRFGSRNTNLGTDGEEIGGQFEDVTDYIIDRATIDDVCQVEEIVGGQEIVVFGENLGFDHIIRDYVDETPIYQIFDIYLVDDQDWARRDDLEWFADILDLPVAPVVQRTTVEDFDHTEYEIPSSQFRPGEEPPEGVVVENQRNMARGKLITEQYTEKKKEGYGGDGRRDDIDGTKKIVNTYVTEARIKKQVHKMQVEEDRELSMEMMEDLHERVWEDCWEEEWQELIYKDETINLKEGHNMAARKSAAVLRDMITNRDAS